MDWTALFELVGKATTAVAAVIGGWWAYEKWRTRDEHFPRIVFEVTANFIGVQRDRVVTEIVATLENTGVVPLRYSTFGLKVLGIRAADNLERGDTLIRSQLMFPILVCEGSFIPEHWEYSFIYPGVKSEYNFVIDIPQDISFIRVQADLEYLLRGESHHAVKVLRVPNQFSSEKGEDLEEIVIPHS